jgi:hypothetical protein
MKRHDIKVIIPDNGGVVFLDVSAKVMFTSDVASAQAIGETLLAMIAAMSMEAQPQPVKVQASSTVADLIK